MSLVVPSIEPSVLAELYRARRRRRIETIDVFEVLYRAYILAIVAGIAVLELGGLTQDRAVKGSQLAYVGRHGAAALGLLVAVAIGLALRSATRGGPVSLEAPFVRHVLGSPVPRRLALRQPTRQLLRRFIVVGTVIGAVAGAIAFRRLPGAPAAWIAACALSGAGAGAAVGGAGLLGSGLRVGKLPAAAAALVVLAWSALDLWKQVQTSPLTLLGQVALWPLHVRATGLIGLLVALALVVAGTRLAGGLSLEAAERRSGLVGALRFAATTRDLRAVVVLRRQLTNELARQRPWFRLAPVSRRRGVKGAVSRRDLQGALRWPAVRLVRMVCLAALAGLCMRGAWGGTAPLILPAGVCMWAAALEATEGLAQEIDHPDRTAGYPRSAGFVELRHLLVPSLIMVVLGMVGVAVTLAFGGVHLDVEIGGVTLLPAALTAVTGAAVSTLREPAKAGSGLGLAPEVAGVSQMVRELLPPLIATVGMVPVLVARAAFRHGQQPLDAAVNVAFLLLLVPIAGFGWVHARGRFATMMGEAAAAGPRGRPGMAGSVGAAAARQPPPPTRSTAERPGETRTRSNRGGRR